MKKEIICPEGLARPAAPYASAIRVSGAANLVFVSGVVSCGIDGRITHPRDILGQTRQMIRNLIATLAAAGARAADGPQAASRSLACAQVIDLVALPTGFEPVLQP
ncbi:MAG: hypothetical protein IT480_06160 [Gammaproteobacteria bacterium]|nr:hypothetical protein [Gammaproteobacteria bacterium]